MPPPYPVSEPSLPITRWHGTMMLTGLRPLAADGPDRVDVADDQRLLQVAARLPVRDVQQRPPHPQLEVGAMQVERYVELGQLAREVRRELPGNLAQCACTRLPVVSSSTGHRWVSM